MNDINPAPDQQRELSPDERNWGMFCHLAGFAGIIIPFGSIIGPLVIWLIKRDEMPFVNYNGKEALNFQITYMVAFLVSVVLMSVVIGFLMMAVVGIAWLVFTILAISHSSKGEYYRFPYIFRVIN
ncbi:MAG TPA: DUF4870 domain-containing protein [Candidatus Kapabacteria bacterium]|nr:DUF4870 domain-containing protein [Candidatus Kapabacteria bacterium]